MQKELIKIKAICNFQCIASATIEKYCDEVPEEGSAWKWNRHSQSQIVKVGTPWIVISDTDEPLWSEYVILDGSVSADECRQKADELIKSLKKVVADSAAEFLQKSSDIEFQSELFEIQLSKLF